MRKLLCLSFTIVLALSLPTDLLYSQTSDKEMKGLLKSLKNEKKINYIFDMSQAKIHGKSEAEFVYLEDLNSLYDWTSLWEVEYKPNLIHDFLVAFTSQMTYRGNKVKFGDYADAKYQIRIVVKLIAPKGSTKMQVFFEDAVKQSVLFQLDIVGIGGVFGSKVNLMGDGFKEAGKDLAKQLDYVFRKGKVGEFNKKPFVEKSFPLI